MTYSMENITVSLDQTTLDIIDSMANKNYEGKRSQAIRFIVKCYSERKK